MEEKKEINLGDNNNLSDANAKKKNVRKKIFGYLFFFVVSAAVIVGMILFEDKSGDPMSGMEAFALLAEHPLFTCLAVIAFPLMILTDFVSFRVLSLKLKPTCSSGACLRASFYGRYFDRITPWSTGGEPFQIFYFHKCGLSTGDAGSVTVSRRIIRFFAVAVVVILILACSQIATNIYVMLAAIISILIGLIMPSFMLLCAFKPVLGKKITSAFITFFCKLRIIKNRQKVEEKVDREVGKFLSGIKFLSGNKIIIIVVALAAITDMFITNSIPFLVMKALGVTQITYWETLVLCLFVNYASAFAPTPGSAGLVELSFYAIFSAFMKSGLLFWAVLFWRILVFYIPILIGFVMQMVESIVDIAKMRRLG